MSCDVGRRRGSDAKRVAVTLVCRPATTAPIRPLAWEPPYATELALEKAKRQEKKMRKNTVDIFLNKSHSFREKYDD